MRTNKKAFGLISAGLLAGSMALASMSASATTLEKMKFDEIVMKSSACVVGEVINIQYGQDQDGIYTLATYAVSKVAFGDIGDTITVRSDGGRVKKGKLAFAEVNAGSPMFFDGTKAMLFLSEGANGSFRVVGYNQGIFPIDTQNNARVSMPQSFGGISSVDSILDRARARRSNGNLEDIAQ